MSHHEYMTSKALGKLDPPFYALIMAAMRKADTDNLAKLQAAWRDVWNEFRERYWSPLGILDGEGIDPELVMRSTVDASGRVTREEEP